MDIKQPVQKVVTWAKANPLIAGVLLIGVIALAYLASQNKGKMSAVSGSVVDDAAGAGILGGDDEIPLVPYVDFDPVSGIPTWTSPNGGYYEPVNPVIEWIQQVAEPITSARLDRMIMTEPGVWVRPADTLHSPSDLPSVDPYIQQQGRTSTPAPPTDDRVDRIIRSSSGIFTRPPTTVTPVLTGSSQIGH